MRPAPDRPGCAAFRFLRAARSFRRVAQLRQLNRPMPVEINSAGFTNWNNVRPSAPIG
jgi:hypothetical protein